MYFRQAFRTGGNGDKRLGHDRENISQMRPAKKKDAAGYRKYKPFSIHIEGKMEQDKQKTKSRLKMRSHGGKRKTMKGRYKDAMGRDKMNPEWQKS